MPLARSVGVKGFEFEVRTKATQGGTGGAAARPDLEEEFSLISHSVRKTLGLRGRRAKKCGTLPWIKVRGRPVAIGGRLLSGLGPRNVTGSDACESLHEATKTIGQFWKRKNARRRVVMV